MWLITTKKKKTKKLNLSPNPVSSSYWFVSQFLFLFVSQLLNIQSNESFCSIQICHVSFHYHVFTHTISYVENDHHQLSTGGKASHALKLISAIFLLECLAPSANQMRASFPPNITDYIWLNWPCTVHFSSTYFTFLIFRELLGAKTMPYSALLFAAPGSFWYSVELPWAWSSS